MIKDPPHSFTTIGPPEELDDELNLRDLLDMLHEGRKLLAAAVGAVLALGIFYAWTATPIYQADALVQVEQSTKTMNAAFGDVAEMLGGPTPVTAELEIVKSRMVIGRVVDTLGLEIAVSPRRFPLIGGAISRTAPQGDPRGALFGLSGYAWGGETIRVSRLDLPQSLVGKPLTLRVTDSGYELLNAHGAVLVSGAAGTLAQSADAQVAVFVQELVARPGARFTVLRKPRAQVIQGIQGGLKVVEKGRFSGILSIGYEHPDPVQVTAIVTEISRAYQQQNVDRRSTEAAQTLEFLNKLLPELKLKMETAEAALNAYRLQRGSADLTKETELILQQSVQLETTRLELDQKRQELARRFTNDHPAMQALDAQLARTAQEQSLVMTRVRGLPETQQELLRLARDVEVNTGLYTSLLNTAQELQVAKAGTVGNVRIIDAAVQPVRPSKPRKAKVLMLSLVLGGFVGIGLILVRRALRQGVDDPSVIENRLGLPTYAAVPFSAAQARLARKLGDEGKGPFILVQSDPGDAAVEALRSLRTSLHFGLVDARNNVVAITGPTPGLGKSFLAINLGAVLALSGKRVVVVDADLRLGHLHRFVGCEQAPGLSNCIAGDSTLDQAIRTTSVENLWFLPAGVRPPNPAELVLNDRFAVLVNELSAKFDHVLIDTPPVLAVTDAVVISRLAGCSLLALKAGEHPLRAVEESIRRLRNAGVELRGSVFNQIAPRSRRYGYAYDYNYAERKPR